MDEIDYKSNSNKSKSVDNELENNENHKLEKVVTGKVITKKRSGLQKFTDEFISEDAKNIKSYVIRDVLIPAIKKALSDIVTDGIDMLLYGESRRDGRRTMADKVSYRNYYDRGSTYKYRDEPRSTYSAYSYDDIILDSRGEAEDVLSRMDELIESYGLVRVADLYDLVGITGNYTDNKYGWTNIRNAQIIRVRDGYMIKMPRAIPID